MELPGTDITPVYTPAGAAPTQITPAPIVGITSPVAGATPQTTVETDRYTGTIAWFNYYGGDPISGNFAYGTIHGAEITLTPKPGYTFEGLADEQLYGFTVNGGKPHSKGRTSSGVIFVSVWFPVTKAPTQIIPAPITGIASPVVGATPQTTFETDRYTGTIEWLESNNPLVHTGPFAAGAVYSAVIRLTAKEGYTFGELTKEQLYNFKVNGIVPQTSTGGEYYVSIQVWFPKTEATHITPAAIEGVDSPVTGAEPDMDIPATEQYTITNIQWLNDDRTLHTGPFATGKVYKAGISLMAQKGYSFEGLTEGDLKGFKVNGIEPDNVYNTDDTWVTLDVTFPATK